MTIRLVTKKDGKTILDKYAKKTATLWDILEIAENEVTDGYADYSCVFVNGDVYAEYES